MNDDVSIHYGASDELLAQIARSLHEAGLEPESCRTSDLEAIDEFHFRGRAATLELLSEMPLTSASRVLDIGSGLGGVARAIAEATGCHVTGLDFVEEFCRVATTMSRWVRLHDKTGFHQGDATDLPFPNNEFDHATSVHVAMNIARKDKMYSEARRVLKPGGRFVVYDILQGEGGDMFYPTPWASEPSASHLVTLDEMQMLLTEAGFSIKHVMDSSTESLEWLETRTAQSQSTRQLPVTIQLLFGETYQAMIKNQLRGLRERRMLTYSFICEA